MARAPFMSDNAQPQLAPGDKAARQLANATKTPPQFAAISPAGSPNCCNGSRWKPAATA